MDAGELQLYINYSYLVQKNQTIKKILDVIPFGRTLRDPSIFPPPPPQSFIATYDIIYIFEKPSSMAFRYGKIIPILKNIQKFFLTLNLICFSFYFTSNVFLSDSLNLRLQIFFFSQMVNIKFVVFWYFAQYFCCKNHVFLTYNILYIFEEPSYQLLKSLSQFLLNFCKL